MQNYPASPSEGQPDGRGHIGDLLMGGVIGLALGVALNPARKAAMQALEATAGDWFEILKTEHRAAEKLLDKLVATEADEVTKRQLLLTQIAYALNKHAITEENVVYPALREKDLAAAKKLGAEHLDVKALIARLQYVLEKDDPAWIETARELRDHVLAHAQEEEDVVLASFHDGLGEEANASLTRRLNWEGLKVV